MSARLQLWNLLFINASRRTTQFNHKRLFIAHVFIQLERSYLKFLSWQLNSNNEHLRLLATHFWALIVGREFRRTHYIILHRDFHTKYAALLWLISSQNFDLSWRKKKARKHFSVVIRIQTSPSLRHMVLLKCFNEHASCSKKTTSTKVKWVVAMLLILSPVIFSLHWRRWLIDIDNVFSSHILIDFIQALLKIEESSAKLVNKFMKINFFESPLSIFFFWVFS